MDAHPRMGVRTGERRFRRRFGKAGGGGRVEYAKTAARRPTARAAGVLWTERIERGF